MKRVAFATPGPAVARQWGTGSKIFIKSGRTGRTVNPTKLLPKFSSNFYQNSPRRQQEA
jgi:hypothetical protein